MDTKTGVARLRQAIENQASEGEACFALPVGEARAFCDEVDDELARLAWAKDIPAPVDADGEVVPLTTEVMYDEGGKEVLVNHFRLAGHNVGDRLKWRVREMPGAVLDLDLLHLHRPDSWERLEEDVARCDDKLISCAYYNRVLGECDGCPSNGPEYCGSKIMHDILRRAKALAKALAPQPLPHGVKEVTDD